MILYETKYLAMKAYKRENKPDWVYVVRPNAKNVAVILPVLKKPEGDEVLFLITKRPPIFAEKIADFCIEIPAGLVGDEDKNETTNDALQKELLEETGLIAERFEICNSRVSSSGGLTSETSTIAKAIITDFEIKMPPVSDGGVITDRICVKTSDIKQFLQKKEKEGFAISAQTLAALYYL